tara:strand:+ start:48 stop:1319 length:1272 start_codon:yes stop_codon:yes gene_type:complete
MKLTRYLYHLDDVSYSFVTSLLKGDDIKEVLFWTSELYYSGYYDILYNLIWKVYYDFYALMNPLLEKKINRLNNEIIEKFNSISINTYFNNNEIRNKNNNESKNNENIKLTIKTTEDETIKNIIFVLYLLFSAECIDYRVFELRFLNPLAPVSTPLKIEIKNIKWLKKLKSELSKENIKLSKTEELLLINIHNNNDNNYNNDNNIKYYLLKLDVYRSYYILKKYYSIVKNIKLKERHNYLKEILYEDKYHILIALICYFELDENEIVNKRITIKKYNNDFYNYFCETNNTNNIKPYNVLKEKRDYSINTNIGCFKINLNKFNNICKLQILNNYWEYYCNFSPIWKDRFEKYNCIFQNKNAIFKNDDYLEEFYELYGYEPDEQSNITKFKSVCKIKNNNIQEWLNYIFDEEIEFNPNIIKIINY